MAKVSEKFLEKKILGFVLCSLGCCRSTKESAVWVRALAATNIDPVSH